jgi:hypothetical protein
MILFHGSNCEFDTVSLEKSKNNRDFGKGLYTTTLEEQAKEWAEIIVLRTENGPAFLYEFELPDFVDLSVKTFTGYTLEWLEFVMENRTHGGVRHPYDVVVGPVADDRTRDTIALYMLGIYTEEDALKRLIYMKYNDQVSFHTEESLAKLKLLGVRQWTV